MDSHLISSRHNLEGDDPIFRINALAQSRKAQGHPVINLSIGALLDEEGQLVTLQTVTEVWHSLTSQEIHPYAPILGDPEFIDAITHHYWPQAPSPVLGCATPGATGALVVSLRNLLEPGQTVHTFDPCWTPYETLAFENQIRVETVAYPMSDDHGSMATLESKLESTMKKQGRILFWLNDPCHNPTGQHLSTTHRQALLNIFDRLSQQGPVSVILDLAYLEYARDSSTVKQILEHYAQWASSTPALLGAALSISKPLTLYGARCGALVFPWRQDPQLKTALAISCRGIFSNAPRAPQSLVKKLYRDSVRLERLRSEHRHWSSVLVHRADQLSQYLSKNNIEHSYFEGGFFVTLPHAHPDQVVQALQTHDIYLIPLEQGLRVAICALQEKEIKRLVDALRLHL
jgi:aspartate/tyrosine/aromatic aminotransferase